MPFLVCKLYHLILNGRAVSGACALNNSGIDRRTIQIRTNDFMGSGIRISEPTGDLFFLHAFRIRRKRKRHYPFIPELLLHFREIYAPFIHSRWCSCFETLHLNSKLFQRIRQIYCRLQAIRPSITDRFPAQTSGIEIRPRTQDHRLAFIDCTCKNPNPYYLLGSFSFFRERNVLHPLILVFFRLLGNQFTDFRLLDRQMFLILQYPSHLPGIFRFIRLCSQRMDCRSL